MTKLARKLYADLDEGVLDGSELLVVEIAGRKYKKTGAGGGGGIAWIKKTATYTLAAGEGVLASGTFTVSAPGTIAEGDTFAVHNFGSGLVTLARNGHTLRYAGADVADDVTLAPGDTAILAASDSTNMEII